MRTSIFSWMVLCVGITLNPAHASNQAEETPQELPGGFIINAQEVKVFIEQSEVYLADCRSPFNYGKGHLPGARSLEYKINYHVDEAVDDNGNKPFMINALPDNKKDILIFYSHGSTGWKSYRAAQSAIAQGYSQVHWFRGGVKEWLGAGYQLEY